MDQDGGGEFKYNPQAPTAPVESSTPSVSNNQSPQQVPNDVIEWQASEFIYYEKNTKWFVLLAAGTILLCVIIFLVTRSILSVAVVVLAMITFGLYARQAPRTLKYILTHQAINVGSRRFSHNDFQSFYLTKNAGMLSIVLMPIKRFMPPITMYLPPDQVEEIITFLSTYIPYSRDKQDAIDTFMHRLRF